MEAWLLWVWLALSITCSPGMDVCVATCSRTAAANCCRWKPDHVASNERCHPFPVVYHKRLCPQIVIDTQKRVLPVPTVP